MRTKKLKALIPLPSKDFDPTEAAITWKVLTENGIEVHFATPGGHAPGMTYYLEAPELHRLTSAFFEKKKPVGAICHGVVLAARSKRKDGKSVLWGRKTTALLKKQEMAAFNLTRLWLGTYYRTYPATTVQDEVTAALASPSDFIEGPAPLIRRDAPQNMKIGFTVTDGNYISARWPGDAYNFAAGFLRLLAQI